MGGYGSGRRNLRGSNLCEHYKRIDLTLLRKDGVLRPGTSAVIKWSRHGEPNGSVGVKMEKDGLRLNYHARFRNDDWRQVDELISFTATKTNFGGTRQWFVCPGCEKRCRVLFGGTYFRCRTCHRLRYESQLEDTASRLMSQRHKLRARLGQSGSLSDLFPLKPKGMHWATYWRHYHKDQDMERRWLECAAIALGLFREE